MQWNFSEKLTTGDFFVACLSPKSLHDPAILQDHAGSGSSSSLRLACREAGGSPGCKGLGAKALILMQTACPICKQLRPESSICAACGRCGWRSSPIVIQTASAIGEPALRSTRDWRLL